MAETESSAAATDTSAELRSYFATPVAVAMLPDAALINATLRETALARERSDPGVEHSNLGGWQSGWDFDEWGGEMGHAVLGSAGRLASRMTVDRAGGAVDVDWKVNAWVNINRAGHANEFHIHPGAYWSATYYVDDGGIGADPALGGEFEIRDPRGAAPAMYAPYLCFALPGGLSAGGSDLIQPKAGMLVMFPSWLSHGVRPYRGDGTRISIAMNFSV